jgi:hypothetical protein
MDWRNLLTKITTDVKQIKEKMYPDMSWKPENLPTRKEWNTLNNLIMSIEKDCEWLEEYKNPTKRERKIRYLELSEKLANFMRLKERNLTCYPEPSIMMFLVNYLFATNAIKGNKIVCENLTKEFVELFPLKDNNTVFHLQPCIKNFVVMDDTKRKLITPSEDELKRIEHEVETLKRLKELKKNREEFEKVWTEFFELKK